MSQWTARASGACVTIATLEIQLGAGCMVHADVLEHPIGPPSEILTVWIEVTQPLAHLR